MDEEVRIKVGVDPAHTVRFVKMSNSQRKGQDIDLSVYEIMDAEGRLVRKVETKEMMSIYPPHSKSFEWNELPLS